MTYTLSNSEATAPKQANVFASLARLWPLMREESGTLVIAFLAILLSSGLSIWAPILIAKSVDTYILNRDMHGVLVYSGFLLAIYTANLVTGYIQTRAMGGVGQRVLFRLRNALFNKLQELPIAFFNQNKGGDLISRINNDTDKLNQFFSQGLIQFLGNIFVIIGTGIAMVVVNDKLGSAALLPAAGLVVITLLTSSWIKSSNGKSLRAFGSLNAEIQESLENFKAIIAFNRRDYFRTRFNEVNQENYTSALRAGIANNTYTPVFGLASNLATLIVITYGLSLISDGTFTYGLLISFLAYVSRFYDPLRQMASIWSSLQVALAGWDRIVEILAMESNLSVLPRTSHTVSDSVLAFNNVGFSYPSGKTVLRDITFNLEKGKTYALVGPTGGGKTTTASLMARLYDPSEGTIMLNGADIRSYEADERTAKIGFILQDPFLFSGTVRENILYGNPAYQDLSSEQLAEALTKEGLDNLIGRFDEGLETKVSASGESISLGQRQLIAFIRAVLRHPDLLILDEATANVDTVTEQLLEDILKRLPTTTTKVIIAHRLNTIENADQIFFVNSGTITLAGSLSDAVAMLANGARTS